MNRSSNISFHPRLWPVIWVDGIVLGQQSAREEGERLFLSLVLIDFDMADEKTLRQITDVFPGPQHKNREVWMMCLPHAQCDIASFRKSSGETKGLPWSLLHILGQCSHLQGQYAEAEAN